MLNGGNFRLDGGAMHGVVPKTLWSKLVSCDALNRCEYATRCLLIEAGGKRVLVETGNGDKFSPKLKDIYGIDHDRSIVHALAEEGIDPASIDVVVLSHLHFDHAGGLLAPWAEGQPPSLLFPNATYIVGREHFERARQPHPRDRASFIPELVGLLEGTGRLELVDGKHSKTLGNSVLFHYSDGHTPGLMLAEIAGPDMVDGVPHGGVVFCADLIPGRPWVHVPITTVTP